MLLWPDCLSAAGNRPELPEAGFAPHSGQASISPASAAHDTTARTSVAQLGGFMRGLSFTNGVLQMRRDDVAARGQDGQQNRPPIRAQIVVCVPVIGLFVFV